MRKLVELNPETLCATEVDIIRAIREATTLRDYLLRYLPDGQSADVLCHVLPFCESIIEGKLNLPILATKRPINVERMVDAGYDIPGEFQRLWAPLSVTVTGMRVDPKTQIQKDGKIWAWAEFEA